MKELLKKIAVERPVGTPENENVNSILEKEFRSLGMDIVYLPLDCDVWHKGEAFIDCGGTKTMLHTSPYSQPCSVCAPLVSASFLAELHTLDCAGKILVLLGELSKEQLQPKDYLFYFPDEHRELISLLEDKHPAALICVCGKSEMCGMEPFNMFNDGKFLIPSAYTDAAHYNALSQAVGSTVTIRIDSQIEAARSRQLIAKHSVADSHAKIVVCAHMDTQYDTTGALDNASGVASIVSAARQLSDAPFDIEFVPFNGEEYYRASGELAYLQYLGKDSRPSLVINVDSPCHAGSDISVSFYNFTGDASAAADALISEEKRVVRGEEWYAGDHAMFVFGGVPCAAVSSSDLFTGGLCDTHTPRDTVDTVNAGLIDTAGGFIVRLAEVFVKSL